MTRIKNKYDGAYRDGAGPLHRRSRPAASPNPVHPGHHHRALRSIPGPTAAHPAGGEPSRSRRNRRGADERSSLPTPAPRRVHATVAIRRHPDCCRCLPETPISVPCETVRGAHGASVGGLPGACHLGHRWRGTGVACVAPGSPFRQPFVVVVAVTPAALERTTCLFFFAFLSLGFRASQCEALPFLGRRAKRCALIWTRETAE